MASQPEIQAKTTHSWQLWLIDASIGIGLALLLLLILFFAGGGSNFIYIDF